MANKLKIIGGEWRSRVITFADIPELRPTPARVRETLFNWLQQDLVARRCLDLFAGSGALGFEAASRGAKAVTQVEKDPTACKHLLHNASLLDAKQVQVVCQDVVQFLQQGASCYDVIFLDPPFKSNLAVPVCQLIQAQQWLAPRGLCYIETPAQFDLSGLPQQWRGLKHKTAGDVGYHLFINES